MTTYEMESDIAAVQMYKQYPNSHPTTARAYTIVHDWKRQGLLDADAHAMDTDIIEQMEQVLNSRWDRADAQSA